MKVLDVASPNLEFGDMSIDKVLLIAIIVTLVIIASVFIIIKLVNKKKDSKK